MKSDWMRTGIPGLNPTDQHRSVDTRPAARGIESRLPKASIPDARQRGGLTVRRAQEIAAQSHSPVLTDSVVVNARILGRARQFFVAAGDLHDTLNSSGDAPVSSSVRIPASRPHVARLFNLFDKKSEKSD